VPDSCFAWRLDFSSQRIVDQVSQIFWHWKFIEMADNSYYCVQEKSEDWQAKNDEK
jgi:hypothetical protein